MIEPFVDTIFKLSYHSLGVAFPTRTTTLSTQASATLVPRSRISRQPGGKSACQPVQWRLSPYIMLYPARRVPSTGTPEIETLNSART